MKIGINDVFKQTRLFFILYAILLVACIIIKLLYTKEQIYFTVNSFYTPFGDFIAPYLTDMGNGWFIVTVSIIILLFSYRTSFLIASTYAITSLSAQVLKYIYMAPRPTLLYHSQLYRIHLVKGIYQLQKYSFPSGHTVTAFSTALLLVYLVKNKNWTVPLFILAIAIGYSRMYLSQHFYEDVVAGSFIGVVLVTLWLGYIDRKQFIHGPTWRRGLLWKPKVESSKS